MDLPSTGLKSATPTQAAGLSTFGDFQLASFWMAYRTLASGAWEQTANWEMFNGGSWVPATSFPLSAGNAINILNPHTISTSTTFSVDELYIEAGATLVLGADMTVNDGDGTDVSVNGTLDCSGIV